MKKLYLLNLPLRQTANHHTDNPENTINKTVVSTSKRNLRLKNKTK